MNDSIYDLEQMDRELSELEVNGPLDNLLADEVIADWLVSLEEERKLRALAS